MRGNRKVDTAPEVALRSELHRRGLRFRKNIVPETRLQCRADVVFPSARVAVFVDGCFWHSCSEHGTKPPTNSGYWSEKLARNVARDRRNDAMLASAGWTILRVWEHEPSSEAADRIASLVAAKRPGRHRDRPSADGLPD